MIQLVQIILSTQQACMISCSDSWKDDKSHKQFFLLQKVNLENINCYCCSLFMIQISHNLGENKKKKLFSDIIKH